MAALFARRNFVHLATLLPDGSPHSIPVWAILEGGRIAFFTQSSSREARNLALDRAGDGALHRAAVPALTG